MIFNVARVLRAGALGRSMAGRNALSWLGNSQDVLNALGEFTYTAAGVGFDTALSMCGNEGQVSIITSMGFEVFLEAAQWAANGGDAVTNLLMKCPYPEAVGEILDEAGMAINDILDESLGRAEEAEEEEELEEGEDGYEEQ